MVHREDTDHRAPPALLNVRQIRRWSHRSHWAPWARLSWRAWHTRESRTPLGSWWTCNQEHFISIYSIIKTNTESRSHHRPLSFNSALCLVAFTLRCSWKFKLNMIKSDFLFLCFLGPSATYLLKSGTWKCSHSGSLVPQPSHSSRDLPTLPL